MNRFFVAAAAASVLAPSVGVCQIVSSVTGPTAPIAASATNVAYLRTGTEIPLKLREDLTTKGKMLRVGQRFNMETAENVSVNGMVVIPAGSPAVGEITDVRNKGMWGKSGHLGARVLYVTVNGRQIRMSGAFDDKGVTGTAGVIGAIAFVPVAGFFTTGTSAHVPLGAAVKGFVDEDVPLQMAAATPAPLQVAAPAAFPVAPVTGAPAVKTFVAAAPGDAKVQPAVLKAR